MFEGKTLRTPCGVTSEPLDQAKQQANRLRTELSKAVGEPVRVEAILTFPGWWITRQGKSDVMVLNPREIKAAVLKASSVLPKQLLDRVTYQLDRKCRDVEL